MLLYFDDLLHIVFNPNECTDNLYLIYMLKDSFVPPDQYLDDNIEKAQLKDGQSNWSTNFVDCLKSTIGNGNIALVVDKTANNN